MHQSSLHTWRSLIAVVFPGTDLFYYTLVLSENHLASTYEEVPPHVLSAFPYAHEALRKAWHAAGVLYFSPALCGESFCPAKQTTHALASCAPSRTKSDPLGIAQLFAYKRNEVLSLCIDKADGLLIGVAEFEQVIGNVESG